MLTFNDYKELAKNNTLKNYEKVGFSSRHREDMEDNIFFDVVNKLNISGDSKVIVDIGCGCSRPVEMLIDLCRNNNHSLYLIDSKEMLDNIRDEGFIYKMPMEFPVEKDIEFLYGKSDYVLCYSVIQIVTYYSSIFRFLDESVDMLKPGGRMLLGDIPNITKKKRFLSSNRGIEFHKSWSGSNEKPQVDWNILHKVSEGIDDSIIFSILQRYRSMGCETYLLEQPEGLPMSNTREDILIVKN